MPHFEHGPKWIRRTRRLALYIRDGFRCVYCQTDLLDSGPKHITLDHVDGTLVFGAAIHTNDNLVTCCHGCNRSKGESDFAVWCERPALARVVRQTGLPVAGFLLISIGMIRSARATKKHSQWFVAVRKAQAYCALLRFSQPATASLKNRRRTFTRSYTNA